MRSSDGLENIFSVLSNSMRRPVRVSLVSFTSVVKKAVRHGVKVYVTGAAFDVRKELAKHEVKAPEVLFLARIEDAVGAVHRLT